MSFRSKIIIILVFIVVLTLYTAFYLYENEDSSTLILNGNIDIRQADLGFRVTGKLTKMNKEEGDVVEAGSLLAELDHEPLKKGVEESEAALKALKISLENASSQFKRRQELKGTHSISEEDLQSSDYSSQTLQANVAQAEAALANSKIQFEDSYLFAPSKGTILTRVREPGAIVRSGEPVYLLSLASPLWVRTYVSELDLGLIHVGMAAEVVTDNEKIYQGTIGFISPTAEFTPKNVETQELRSQLVYQVRVLINQPDPFLKQGMPVTVRLPLENGSH